MPIYKGSTKIKELYIGNTKIKEVYHGSTLVFRSSQYSPEQIVFESSTPGTYTLNLLESGKYEVTVVAGGAGSKYYHITVFGSSFAPTSITKIVACGGASGSCFKGDIYLSSGNQTIVVGAAGKGNKSSSSSNMIGGVSSIGSIVSCPSQKSTGSNGVYGAYQNNGSPTVTSTVYKTYINAHGNDGESIKIGDGTRAGGKSTYDGTTTGYGAGASANNAYANGKAGYVKIVYIGG